MCVSPQCTIARAARPVAGRPADDINTDEVFDTHTSGDSALLMRLLFNSGKAVPLPSRMPLLTQHSAKALTFKLAP
jgi:hypothetical protein